MGPNERIYKEAVRPVVQPSQGVTATCKWLLKIWLILGHSFYPSDDLSTMKLVCNVARGTDNLPANFCAYMTSRSSYGQTRVKCVKL